MPLPSACEHPAGGRQPLALVTSLLVWESVAGIRVQTPSCSLLTTGCASCASCPSVLTCVSEQPWPSHDLEAYQPVCLQAIMGMMRGSTRILVTHQLQYLPHADIILVLEGGRISARGSHAELCQQGIDLHSFQHSQPGTV